LRETRIFSTEIVRQNGKFEQIFAGQREIFGGNVEFGGKNLRSFLFPAAHTAADGFQLFEINGERRTLLIVKTVFRFRLIFCLSGGAQAAFPRFAAFSHVVHGVVSDRN
jgi:hypothetical protein